MDTRAEHRSPGRETAPLFRWQAEDMVLFGERDGDGWVLARAWKDGDRLTDVRRWRFARADRFCVQVERLMADLGASRVWCSDARAAAGAWVDAAGD